MFYQCVEFLEECHNKGGKVIIHCEKGVSRSSTIVIAYLIWKNKMTYDEAYTLVRKKRAIISPNLGFLVQLTNFYKRMYRPHELNNNYIPKMFATGSHQKEDPHTIVVRLIDKLYNGVPGKKSDVLDPRGMFVVGDENIAYFWIGNECHDSYKDKFYSTTVDYFKKL